MKFLVLQHINIEHPGIFLKFMKEDNISIDTIELDENEKIPDLDKYDAMIVMGGPMDTWQEETYPWLKAEKETILATDEWVANLSAMPFYSKVRLFFIFNHIIFYRKMEELCIY